MQGRLLSKIVASLLGMGIAGGCASDDVVTVPYYYDYYVWPVADYGYYVDTSLYYDGYYDPFLGYAALTAASPGAGAPDSGRARTFPRPLNGLFAAWQVVMRPECAPMVEVIDYDGDGVPAMYEATFNCADQTVGERTSSVMGAVSIADADDSASSSGFAVTFTNFTVTTSAGGTTRTRTLNGTATLAQTEGEAFQSHTDLSIAFDFSDAGTTRVNGTYTKMGEGTYAPDAENDVFGGGTVALSGTGTLAYTFRGAQQTRTVTRETTTPLHWNRSCRVQNPDSSGFDAGTLIYRDDQGGKMQMQFDGCGKASVTWSG